MKKHYYTDDILKICDGFHFSVDEIFEKIQKIFPQAGRSSIYRNVESMVQNGELTKIIGIGKKILFEKTKENHIHFICKNSGTVLDLPPSKIQHISSHISSDFPNISIDSVDIKIYGTIINSEKKISA